MYLQLFVILVSTNVATSVTFKQDDLSEFVYDYNSQVLTGLPLHSSIHSGYRMNAKARVQYLTKSKVKVRLENIRLYNIRQPITQIEAHEHQIPEEFLKELVGSESKAITESLMTPFGFEYKDGQVVNLLLDESEPQWSTNAKRGFVSLFEMNLNKRMLLEDDLHNPLSGLLPVNSSYKVLETSAAGMCATWYTVVSPQENSPTLGVTKVRDYTECLDRPVYFQTKYDGFFPIGHAKDNPLTTGAVIRYTVELKNNKIVILSAVAENKIVFSPYLNKGGVTTTVNQTLSLVNIQEISTKIPDTKTLKTSLIMSLPSKSFDSQDPFSDASQKSSKTPRLDEYPVEDILTQLRRAAENNLNLASRESLVHLGVVSEMLSSSPPQVIKELWSRLTPAGYRQLEPTDKHARQILFNVLPHVGTEAAAKQVLYVCSEDQQIEYCDLAFNILTLKATPTESLINAFINLIEQQKDHMSAKMKQTAYLSLGSMGYKLAQARNNQLKDLNKMEKMLQTLEMDSNANTNELVKKKKTEINNRRSKIARDYAKRGDAIVDTIKKLLEQDASSDKVLALKALGNSGLPHAVPVLKKILADPKQHLYLRILAVLGHRRLYFDRVVRKDALATIQKVYHNKLEASEIRSWAFVILMQLHPELPVIKAIAKDLNFEKDAHVSSLVQTYLESHANTTFYPFTTFIKNCSAALKFAPKSNINYQHSFTNLVTKMYDGIKIGKIMSYTSIGSMNRFKSWSVNLDTYIFGLYSNFFEVGIHSMNISQFLNKLYGPRGLLTINKSVFDILKRMPRSTTPNQMIQEIFKLLNVESRSNGPPAAHMYVKLMGHELRYYDVTEYIKSITTEGKMGIRANKTSILMDMPLNINTMYYLMNTKLTLPTEAGFPVSLKLKVSKTLNLQGSVSMTIKPSIFEEDRMGAPPGVVSASLDLKPKAVLEVYGSMGLDAHYIKRVASFQALVEYTMPIQKEFFYDLNTRKFKLVGHVPEFEKPLVTFSMQPYAESVTLSSNNGLSAVQVDSIPLCSHRVISINKFYDLQCLGYKVGFEGQLPNHFSWQHPLHIMGGKTEIIFMKKPMQDSPQVVILTGQMVYPLMDNSSSSLTLNIDNEKIDNNDSQSQRSSTTPFINQEDVTYNDPVDLDSTTITMHQLIGKFEEITGKSIPLHHVPQARGFILSLDASTENTVRKSQMEALWGSLEDGRIVSGYKRIWKSRMPDYTPEEWQMVSELRLIYPVKIHEPKDIFSTTWQQDILRDLQYLVSRDSHQASNYLLHSTLMSEINELNYLAMIRTPTYRVLDNLIPEQLYKLMSVTGDSKWQKYWAKLSHVQDRVTEEKKRLVDFESLQRDSNLMCYINSILKIQSLLKSDLDDMAQGKSLNYLELPVVQWIIYNQATVIDNLEETIQGYIAKGTIKEIKNITFMMKLAEENQDSVQKKFQQVMMMVFKSTEQSISQIQTLKAPKITQDTDILQKSLWHLTVYQMKIIETLQSNISRQERCDIESIRSLMTSTSNNITYFDQIWRNEAIYDEQILNSMLLVTVQNEFIIHLLNVYLRTNIGFSSKQLNEEEIANYESFSFKIDSIYLGQRVSSLFKQKMLNDVIVSTLNENEVTLYEELKSIYRDMAADRRNFELKFAYNKTAHRDVEASETELTSLLNNVDENVNKLVKLQNVLLDQEGEPKVYLVTDFLGITRLLLSFLDFGRQSLIPAGIPESYKWIEKMADQTTKVHRLTSSMSIIFDKFVNQDEKRQTLSFIENIGDQEWDDDKKNACSSIFKDCSDPDSLPSFYSLITGSVNVSWGYSKEIDNSLKVQLMATRSVEQLFHLYKQIDSMVRSTAVENAVNDQLANEPWKFESLVKKMNTYNHLHIAAHYDKKLLSPWILKLSQRLHECIKHNYWNHYTQHEPIESVNSDRTDVIVDLSESNKDWNMYLMTDQETDKFLNIPPKLGFDAFKINQNYKTDLEGMTSFLSGGLMQAQCIATKEKIRTFDQVTYEIPESLDMCRTVLAMDCTEEKMFAINLIKSNSSNIGNGVQILYENKVLEIEPSFVDIQVKVDGNIIVLQENKPVVYNVFLHYNRMDKYIVITRKPLGVVVLLPLAGITVYVESSLVKIQVSDLYKDRLCGLCGNFDDQVSWEFEGPFHELHETPKSFARSYVVHDATCPLPDDRKSHLQHDMSSASIDSTRVLNNKGKEKLGHKATKLGHKATKLKSRNNDAQEVQDLSASLDECAIVKETRATNQMVNKQSCYCFPQKPVAECPASCPVVLKSTMSLTAFNCLPMDYPEIEQIKNKLKNSRWSKLKIKPKASKIKFNKQIAVECGPSPQ